MGRTPRRQASTIALLLPIAALIVSLPSTPT
jgi:hypothetical protein